MIIFYDTAFMLSLIHVDEFDTLYWQIDLQSYRS